MILKKAAERAENTIRWQNLPLFMIERWSRAISKAERNMLEEPIFVWQPKQLKIVSFWGKRALNRKPAFIK